MILQWLLSKSIRDAGQLRRRILRLAKAQEDLLPENGRAALHSAATDLQGALRANAPAAELKARCAALEATAQKWLRPEPHPVARENIDVVLVALVVALGIRTFFLQPMAIPTGSMQPTLYGITVESLGKTKERTPGWLGRISAFLFQGVRYYEIVARSGGSFDYGRVEAPRGALPFLRKQRFSVGEESYTLWLAPSLLPALPNVAPEHLIFAHAGIRQGEKFEKGEVILRVKVIAGDRLFVDRVTYNFRPPRRGEIVIFASTGIPRLTQHTHYIKRLVGLSGETIRIGNDRHVRAEDKRLDASTKGFENIYAFTGPPREDHYSGHVNHAVGEQYGFSGMAPDFPDESRSVQVGRGHYFVLGDNTMNSYDSRYWGDFPREKVIGKCAFVFWPFNDRFGWGFR